MIAARRNFLMLLAVILIAPWAWADSANYLVGTFHLKCPYCGKVDTVDGGTAQHHCENHQCNQQVFVGGNKILVMCPNGHTNEVILHGHTVSIRCKVCNAECQGNW